MIYIFILQITVSALTPMHALNKGVNRLLTICQVNGGSKVPLVRGGHGSRLAENPNTFLLYQLCFENFPGEESDFWTSQVLEKRKRVQHSQGLLVFLNTVQSSKYFLNTATDSTFPYIHPS